MVFCPICSKAVKPANINAHIDSNCLEHIVEDPSPSNDSFNGGATEGTKQHTSSFFKPSAAGRKAVAPAGRGSGGEQQPQQQEQAVDLKKKPLTTQDGADVGGSAVAATQMPVLGASGRLGIKRNITDEDNNVTSSSPLSTSTTTNGNAPTHEDHRQQQQQRAPKKPRHPTAIQQAAPLAERMRPRNLDEVCGQSLVGPSGVLRGLIESDRVPSMILWGSAGTGKTTIARIVAYTVGSRFVEINSTSTGVAECKKLFAEARAELNGVSGRKTIIFCDEIHRFSKTQQDVFLGPVESGIVTLIGATTENPSFKVQNALLSRCRVFTLEKLRKEDIRSILLRAIEREGGDYGVNRSLVDEEMVDYLAAFAEGDARTGLNLLELAMNLSTRSESTTENIKSALTKSLVYDRAGDQHYDTISAFHKSVRGSDVDAALYYLARMIQSGEDPLYIARRMVIIASEDVGLADNTLLPLAIAAHTAASVIGMPECRINLAHVTVALALAPKSTRAYRGLGNATAALNKPGVASLPIPIHLRNAPTRLMKEMGYGKEYKYNPNYTDGQVNQEYLPEELKGSVFLEDRDLGIEVDPELMEGDEKPG